MLDGMRLTPREKELIIWALYELDKSVEHGHWDDTERKPSYEEIAETKDKISVCPLTVSIDESGNYIVDGTHKINNET